MQEFDMNEGIVSVSSSKKKSPTKLGSNVSPPKGGVEGGKRMSIFDGADPNESMASTQATDTSIMPDQKTLSQGF